MRLREARWAAVNFELHSSEFYLSAVDSLPSALSTQAEAEIGVWQRPI